MKKLLKIQGSSIRPILKIQLQHDTLIITFNKKFDAEKFTNYLYKNKIGTKILIFD